MIAPGESLAVRVRADIAASAPAGFLELMSLDADLRAVDANLQTTPELVAETATDLPMLSGLASLQPPARDLRAGLESRMPTVVVADGREVSAGILRLTNASLESSSLIRVDRLRIRAADRSELPFAIGTRVARVRAYVGGSLVGESGPLTPDSTTAWIPLGAPLDIAPGATAPVEVRFELRAGATSASLRLGVDAADIGVIQPQSALLQVVVLPEAGLAFPLWTESAEIGATDFSGSFTNFPNPFSAGREVTTLGYYLSGPARVTIRVMTLRGEPVRTILDDASQSGGMHESDLWDGRNGEGRVVRNGVYIVELRARYDDGSRARAMRKIGVVR
jgi:hypothetical protein